MIGTVAQWLEQVTHNLRVAGSSPAGSTNPPHFPNYLEVNKTKSKNSPTLKNSQKFIRWGQWVNTRSISEKVINFEITDFSMYGDFLPKIDACFL